MEFRRRYATWQKCLWQLKLPLVNYEDGGFYISFVKVVRYRHGYVLRLLSGQLFANMWINHEHSRY